MNSYHDQVFGEERALYGENGVEVKHCRFDGPEDGESALKECKNVLVTDTYFNLRYPFWHNEDVRILKSEMSENCRAALWYSKDIIIEDTKMHGIKALRECENVTITGCDIVSPEFGWSVKNIAMKDSSAESEYFMLRSEKLLFENVSMKGKYSFQYISDSVFEKCEFDTKDAFWHAKNVVVRNSMVKGEYLAWYCENVTFDHCTIIGTQPFCYCKGLKLINCNMIDTDLSFEKSEVEATISGRVESIKNPLAGTIYAEEVGELIMDDVDAKGVLILKNESEMRAEKPCQE